MKWLKTAYAHCDIPCGIYETDTIKHSTNTCRRMLQIIDELGELDGVEKHNTFVRCVVNKEKHAQKIKDELYILWSDYFKPEHLETYPDLHERFWKTIKQASTVKHTASIQEVDALDRMVDDIATIFAETKQA